MIVEGNHEHGYAIGKAASYFFNPACDRVIANVSTTPEGEKLLGGVIFTDYNEVSISAHTSSIDPHWLSRDMLWLIFNYPFVQLGVKKFVVQICSSNLRSIAFCSKLGFKIEARIADIFPDGDLLVLSMRREDCRWLKLKPRGAPSGKK